MQDLRSVASVYDQAELHSVQKHLASAIQEAVVVLSTAIEERRAAAEEVHYWRAKYKKALRDFRRAGGHGYAILDLSADATHR